MKTGVKLRKIDQLIEKFFYDGLRATNSTPVKVISSSSPLSTYSNQQSSRRRKKPFFTSSSASSSIAKTLEEDKIISKKDIESKELVILVGENDKDKDIKMDDQDEEPKPSTSKEVITPNLMLINSKSIGSIDQRSDNLTSGGTLLLGSDPQQQQPSYVSAAAYAAAAGFGAFLNPHQQSQSQQNQQQQQIQQHLSRCTTMDTYPLTAHMQTTTENSP